MTINYQIKQIVLSFIVLTLTAAITYYADSPATQSVTVELDTKKI